MELLFIPSRPFAEVERKNHSEYTLRVPLNELLGEDRTFKRRRKLREGLSHKDKVQFARKDMLRRKKKSVFQGAVVLYYSKLSAVRGHLHGLRVV